MTKSKDRKVFKFENSDFEKWQLRVKGILLSRNKIKLLNCFVENMLCNYVELLIVHCCLVEHLVMMLCTYVNSVWMLCDLCLSRLNCFVQITGVIVLNTQYFKLWPNCLAKSYKKKAKAPSTDCMVVRIGTVYLCPENWRGMARLCQISGVQPEKASPVQDRSRTGSVLDPHLTPTLVFGLGRSGPGPMHTPNHNSSSS